MPQPKRIPWLLRIFHLLLFLYPPDFRDNYGRELRLVMADRWRDERSAIGRLFVLLHAIAGILIEAPAEHLRIVAEDISYALRVFRRQASMSAGAIGILGLGIGAATLVFSLVNGLLLRPIPYGAPDRLVAVDEYSPNDARETGDIPFPNYFDLRARTRLLEQIGVYTDGPATIRGPQGAERIPSASVTDGVLPALGVPPLLGRVFTPEEDRPNAPRAVILSSDLRHRLFGDDPVVVGRTLETLNAKYTIVGVMPPGFHFPANAQAWFPLRMDPVKAPRTDYFLAGVARMKPGVTVEQTDVEIRTLLAQIKNEHKPNNGWIGRARPLQRTMAASYSDAVLTLLAAVSLLLIIACGNVSNLLLLKASARGREVAIRSALGAGRRRIMRQLVTEAMLLGAAGGAIGVLLAYTGVPALLALVPIDLPLWMDFSVDHRVLGFAIVLSLVTSVAFGLLPASSLARRDLVDVLRDGGRTATAGKRQRRIRHRVVVAELALSVTLLAGASLTARNFLALRWQPLGFNAPHVVATQITRPQSRYPDGPAAHDLLLRIRTEIASIPEVESVALSTGVPLDDGWGRIYTIEGHAQPLEAMRFINHIVITPGYFRTLGIQLLQGRDFDEKDFDTTTLIVSHSFAKRHFQDSTALGKRIRFGPPQNNEPWYTIVGVVADSRHGALKGEDRPNVYLPYNGDITPMALVLRASDDPLALAGTIRARMAGIDRDLALGGIATLEEIVERAAWQDRFLTVVFAAFAAFALLLAAAGFYAVLAFSVSLQTHEIGVRMALGATSTRIRQLIARQAFTLAGTGLMIGLATAAVLARLLRNQLYQVSPLDPLSYMIAPIVFLCVGFVAAYVPSRRATRVDPVVALRTE
jgi:putative ABC transport system permease protein